VAGCGTTVSGARKEGPAPSATKTTATAAAPAIASQPAVLATMIRRDASVSEDIREDLTPCAGDSYPLDTEAGNLTAGDGADLVVNVSTCGEGLGIATYVYRMLGGKYQNVFTDEHAPVYGSVDNGKLEIVHEAYDSDDPVSYPIGEEAMTYAWRGNRFVEVARSYSDLTAPSPSPSPEPVSTEPVPLPSGAKPLDPGLPSPSSTGSGTGADTGSGTESGAGSGTATGPASPTSSAASADKGR